MRDFQAEMQQIVLRINRAETAGDQRAIDAAYADKDRLIAEKKRQTQLDEAD